MAEARARRNHYASARFVVGFGHLGTLLLPDAIDFAEVMVNWVWLPEMEPSLFVPPGVGPGGRVIVPSN
jgi:hypothetical protein